jgi:hypothetical protein
MDLSPSPRRETFDAAQPFCQNAHIRPRVALPRTASVSTAPTSNELDDRFPSGEWTGFFIQPDSRRRYPMDTVLHFADGSVRGEGDDAVGRFTIRGIYELDTSRCRWTKQYVGQHAVEYVGKARQGGIVGEWTVPGQPAYWTGPFFLWPRARGDLGANFEKAFLDYTLTVPSAEPAPEEVETMLVGKDS